jgi:hypothetical protein
MKFDAVQFQFNAVQFKFDGVQFQFNGVQIHFLPNNPIRERNQIMVKQIQAITTYRPWLDLGEAAGEKRFMELITQRTTLSSGVVKNVQESEVETLIGLLLEVSRPMSFNRYSYVTIMATETAAVGDRIRENIRTLRRNRCPLYFSVRRWSIRKSTPLARSGLGREGAKQLIKELLLIQGGLPAAMAFDRFDPARLGQG